MSNRANALDKYGMAVRALKDHIKANKAVFDAHQQMVFTVMDRENELRDAVAEEKEGIEDSEFKVTYTPQTQTYADIEELDRLVAQGTISKETRSIVVKNQERPPRITVSEKRIS